MKPRLPIHLLALLFVICSFNSFAQSSHCLQYEGTFQNNVSKQLIFCLEGDLIYGICYTNNQKSDSELTGLLQKDSTFYLKQWNVQNKIEGSYKGKIINDTLISLTWNPPSKKASASYTFQLTKKALTPNKIQQCDTHVHILSRFIKEKSTKDKYNLNLEYPYIIGLTDRQCQHTINDWLRKATLQTMKEFKQKHKSFCATSKSCPQTELQQVYKVNLLVENILTIVYEITPKHPKLAKDLSSIHLFNINLDNCEYLYLEELFKKNAGYEACIADYCTKRIEKTLKEKAIRIDANRLKDVVNYSLTIDRFTINPDGLSLYFPSHELFDKLKKDMWIPITFEELFDALDMEGPVGSLIDN